MPDITMCEGTGCPMCDECYRYTAKPNEYRQSYFDITPYDDESGECEHKIESWNYDNGCGHDQNERYHSF